MRRLNLIVALVLLVPVSIARAQEEAPVATEPDAGPAEASLAPTVPGAPAKNFQVGLAFLPMLLGKVATGPSGDNTSSNLDATYGVGLSFVVSV